MTHFAVVAPPLAGHWDPLRVLGRRLVARGHQVTFVHMPDAAALVRAAELRFAAADDGTFGAGALARYDAQLANAAGAIGGWRMIRATARVTQMLLTALPKALCELRVDAVLADSTEPAGALVARHLGLPFVTTVTGLPLLRDPQVPPPYVDWPYLGGKAGLRRNRGGWRVTDLLMRPIDRVAVRAAEAWGLDPSEHGGLSPLLQVAQCPPGLDFPRAALPHQFRHTGPWREAGTAELPDDGRPLVYCSLGSLQGNRPELFAAMTHACAAVGARAVVATGGRLSEDGQRTLPGGPVVARFWHQPSVLSRCRAAVLHAGFNTVLDALAAGVPMVVAPLAFEQPGTAARVAWTGAGLKLAPRRLARELEGALGAVLAEQRYGNAARALQSEIATLGGVEHAADLIEAAL